MKIGYFLAILVFLASCMDQNDPRRYVPIFRDTNARITAQSDINFTDLTGDWYVVAGYPESGIFPIGSIASLFRTNTEILTSRSDTQRNVSIVGAVYEYDFRMVFEAAEIRSRRSYKISVPLVVTGPGKLTQNPKGTGPRHFWVLWSDASRSVVVVGGPSGQLGFVLSRRKTLDKSQMSNARDIFLKNGYYLDQLVVGEP